jgi:hypothetical protein
MPANQERDPLDSWLDQQVRPLPPPPGTFELITRRARRRRIRKVVVSAASAAAVVAAVAVAVPVTLSLQTSGPARGNLSAGSEPAPGATSPAAGRGRQAPAGSSASPEGKQSPSAGGRTDSPAAGGGYLPPDFLPSSVTWDSLSTGWVLGPAGTPGKCANQNPDICTSVARTDDGGQTWHGLPAPTTGGPEEATGVTGLRFLNQDYGWAYGPELWATGDGAKTWHRVNTGGAAVTDLEASNGQAYALFGRCTPPAGSTGDTIANCRSFTLKTAAAGSDTWTDVPGVPAGLAGAGNAPGSSLLVLAGPTGSAPATGYLVAPDGTLYAGPLGGGAWHRVAAPPCAPGPAANSGLPGQLMLATAGATAAGGTRLALACATPTAADTVVYRSDDGGVTWARQAGAGPAGTAHIGVPESLAAQPDGTLILATQPDPSGHGGIYLLSDSASAQWRAAGLADPSGAAEGFSYVGMTSTLQGVALGGNPGLHAIWMTGDGGQTWQVRPITSG